MSAFSDWWNDVSGTTADQNEANRIAAEKAAAVHEEAVRKAAEYNAAQDAKVQQDLADQAQASAAVIAAQQAAVQAQQQGEAEAAARAQALAQQQAQSQGQTLEQMQQQAAQAQQAYQADQRNTSIGAGRRGIESYFQARGANPAQYGSDIDFAIQQALSGVSPTETNVSPYISNLGGEVFGKAQDLARAGANSQLDQYFTPDYARTRIADTADDQIINDILNSQRGAADQYINNLLRRGVVTDVGAGSARRGLEEQSAGARTQLNQIGADALAGGRQSLQDIEGRARTAASGLRLGTNFNPQTFTSQADQSFNEFMSRLGDSIKSSAPTQLFDTRGLAAVAGAGQGPQNLNFDPQALIGGDTEGEAPALGKPAAKKVGQGRFVF